MRSAGGAAALVLALTACAAPPPATQPMAVADAPAARLSDTLLVMLPGQGDRGDDFRRHGFLDIGEGHGFDMLAADAHIGYYRADTVVERLHDDVIQPARQRGYRHVWLLGISAGGLGAGLYARRHPDAIDGIILLAPYPGADDLVRAIDAAGGVGSWSGHTDAGQAWQRRHWRWLQRVTMEPGQPMIVLGYGDDDRFLSADRMLAARLPKDRVFTAGGGHRWRPVWQTLWRRIVAAGYPDGGS